MSEETASEAVAETVEQAQEAPETFSLEYVQQLRSEAAKYRSERKSAVEAAKVAAEAEFQSKLDEAGARFTELEQAKAASDLEVLKYQKVVEAEVPAELVLDLVALVQGYDEESISESVAKLKSVMGHQVRDRAVDLMQGSGNAEPLNGDPLLARLKQVVGA
jgi:EAL domain-containing protein (putative c-di-GMP-specific phosphodiesterase class I)